LAVHSLKDMPTELPNGLELAATPEREDPRDAMIGGKLADLASGARVGTGSLRRVAQLLNVRPDLKVEAIRGNVDTRLRKLDERQFDAIVLASAGLNRLGWAKRIAEHLSVQIMCPAVGQGALALETRAEENLAREICRKLNHPQTNAAVTAERAVLSELGGGCQVPIGAYADVVNDQIWIRAVVVSTDGQSLIKSEDNGPVQDAAAIGGRLGRSLLDLGAREILESVYG
jgi:hydroxymethylbilane synthase